MQSGDIERVAYQYMNACFLILGSFNVVCFIPKISIIKLTVLQSMEIQNQGNTLIPQAIHPSTMGALEGSRPFPGLPLGLIKFSFPQIHFVKSLRNHQFLSLPPLLLCSLQPVKIFLNVRCACQYHSSFWLCKKMKCSFFSLFPGTVSMVQEYLRLKI